MPGLVPGILFVGALSAPRRSRYQLG